MCGNVLGAAVANDRHYQARKIIQEHVTLLSLIHGHGILFTRYPNASLQPGGCPTSGALMSAMSRSRMGLTQVKTTTVLIEPQRALVFPHGIHFLFIYFPSGDFSVLLAVARAIELAGTCEATVVSSQIAMLTDTEGDRRYPPYVKLLLKALNGPGMPLDTIPFLAQKYLDENTSRRSHISGDRADREPYGPEDNGAAARVLPVALAYR